MGSRGEENWKYVICIFLDFSHFILSSLSIYLFIFLSLSLSVSLPPEVSLSLLLHCGWLVLAHNQFPSLFLSFFFSASGLAEIPVPVFSRLYKFFFSPPLPPPLAFLVFCN